VSARKPLASYLWRRLDQPGLDACCLFRLANGWRLSGSSVFREQRKNCRFSHEVTTDREWKIREARVSGCLGRRPIELRIRPGRSGQWRINDQVRKGMADCIDVDLGFTPATNQIALRRLALRIGERAEAPAAYVQFPRMNLVRLPQTYRRTGRTSYFYESPTASYSGTLQVLPSGAVRDYPDVFELLAADGENG
jgi:uncharacterized protein